MSDFAQVLGFVFEAEGGWTGGREDPMGGETYRGISRRQHPDWRGWPVLDAMPAEEKVEGRIFSEPRLNEAVLEFYQGYLAGAAEIGDQDVADKVGDLLVNLGQAGGTRLVQQALQRLERGPVVVDGRWGSQTSAGIEAEASVNPRALLRALRYFQVLHYLEKDQGPNLKGLLWRACR